MALRTSGYRAPGPGERPARGPGQSIPARLGSYLIRNRRLMVALLLCAASGIAVHQLTPASAERVQVLAATRDLPAGAVLAPSDLSPVDVPPQLEWTGSLKPGTVFRDRQLAVPLHKGQVPGDAQLLGPGLLTGAPQGTAAVPLRIADPASLQLLSPGQLVNIVRTSSESPEDSRKSQVLATAVPVLWTSAKGGNTGQWLGTGETDGLMVVAADPRQADLLAGASTHGKLFFVLVSPGAAPVPAAADTG